MPWPRLDARTTPVYVLALVALGLIAFLVRGTAERGFAVTWPVTFVASLLLVAALWMVTKAAMRIGKRN